MFTEGYIGVSVQGAIKRYRIHKSDAKAGSKLPIHNAIRKYGDTLILDTIVKGDPEYCYFMEGRLRPTPNIGYNVSAGGAATNLGSKHSEETRKKISIAGKGRKATADAIENMRKAKSNNPTIHTDETKEYLRSLSKKRGMSKATRDGASKANKLKVAWKNNISIGSIWLMADKVYTYSKENPTHGVRKIAESFNIVYSQLAVMYKKIKSGWNPFEDEEWLIFSSKLTPDTSGDKSLESANAYT